jgi:hypothetical protein
LRCSAECLQGNSSARPTHRKHMSRVRYFAVPLARWLDPEKEHDVTATQSAHWRVDGCLATSYNIRPIVACAYRGVFIQPLPSNALSKSVILLLLLLLLCYSTPCGGGFEYLHRNPASCRRRWKENPMPGVITGPPCSWGTYIQRPGPPGWGLDATLTTWLCETITLRNPKKWISETIRQHLLRKAMAQTGLFCQRSWWLGYDSSIIVM